MKFNLGKFRMTPRTSYNNVERGLVKVIHVEGTSRGPAFVRVVVSSCCHWTFSSQGQHVVRVCFLRERENDITSRCGCTESNLIFTLTTTEIKEKIRFRAA